MLLTGCMDQDPFGLSKRTIVAPFNLKKFEGNMYFIQKNGHDEDGGGIIAGHVLRIGWSKTLIFAKRYSTFRGDPDGWIIIDVQTQKIKGPLTDEAFSNDYPNAVTMATEEAWKRLK